MAERRGSIAFFSTYRPPVPLDIYSSPIDPEKDDEVLMTDGKSYNYNGREIPPNALKTIVKYRLGDKADVDEDDVDSGSVSGMIFVSERTDNLETLHIALRFCEDGDEDDEDEDKDEDDEKVEIYSLAELYPSTFDGVRMEDSGCFAGDCYLIYVSTIQPNDEFRQPWTAVYRTDLRNGNTIRLTPPGVADFSPSVSPSGRKIAVATLEYKEGGWTGEIENLKTNIVVMDVRKPSERKLVIEDGGWPTWGSDQTLFFHHATERRGPDNNKYYNWGVFRAEIVDYRLARNVIRVTPNHLDAMTPAAIDDNNVAVAIIRERLDLGQPRNSSFNYRHIEVFEITTEKIRSYLVSRRIQKRADHYNPFVIRDDCDCDEGQVLIGYNTCSEEQLERGDISENFDRIMSEDPNEVGVFRVPGVFPTFTKDGRKLAFVDNDFQNVYLADDRGGLRVVFSVTDPDLELDEDEMNVFSPVWNQNPEKDMLYVCVGPPFKANKQVHIYVIFNASSRDKTETWWRRLTTTIDSNNAFPSTNRDGTRLVYRSTRDWVGKEHNSPIRPKNLYIMEDARRGETRRDSIITRITDGDWTDTHCQWSPNGQWIVFSSTRDKPCNAPRLDNGLDPGYYAIYLMKANDPSVVVRVVSSGINGAGHVNHPMFSPDGKSIVFSADLAGVSVEPISLPLFLHSVRPYGDIFSVDIDKNDINENENLIEFDRITHSRYENSTPNWTKFSTRRLTDEWRQLFEQCQQVTWRCPFEAGGAETWQLTGHLGLNKRCC